MVSSTDGDNHVTTDTYDGDGRVLTEQLKNDQGVVVSTDSLSYDGDGDVTTTTDGDQNVAADSYNADGQPLGEQTTDGQGHVVGSDGDTYDQDGNLLTKDGKGDSVNYIIYAVPFSERKRCQEHIRQNMFLTPFSFPGLGVV